MERGTLDGDGVSHSAKVAWRALALLQTEIEESLDEEERKAERLSRDDNEKRESEYYRNLGLRR